MEWGKDKQGRERSFSEAGEESEIGGANSKKNGFKNNILPLVCDNRDIIVNLIKNTNKKQSYVR